MVGDALETVTELDAALGSWRVEPAHMARAKALFKEWDALLDTHQAPTQRARPDLCAGGRAVNAAAGENDTLISAAGGLPGEVTKGWRVKAPNTFDLEFGFSCMGYEIAAGWGHAMANSGPGGLGGTPIVMVGDGTYMMMNSDIYSTVLSGHKMIVVVCDNGGFAVINRLQQAKGVPGFNNLLVDCRVLDRAAPLHVDFAKHAESMGAAARHCESLADFASRARMGEGQRPHHRPVDRLGRLCLGARRRRLGRRRAGSLVARIGSECAQGSRNRSARSSASECEHHESQTRNSAHRLVERRSRRTFRRREPRGMPAGRRASRASPAWRPAAASR